MIELVEFASALKEQIATIFELIGAIGITKLGPLLLLATQAKTQTGRIDPAVADLGQSGQSTNPTQAFRQTAEGDQV